MAKKGNKAVYTLTSLSDLQRENVKSLPKVSINEKTYRQEHGGVSRRAYLDYRAKLGGFDSYAEWIRARKEVGLSKGSKVKKGQPKKHKGGHGLSFYVFDWAMDKIDNNEDAIVQIMNKLPDNADVAFVVLSNNYKLPAKKLADFTIVQTLFFPVSGDYSWANRQLYDGESFTSYFYRTFNIRPFDKSKKYALGIKTVTMMIRE